MLGKYVIDAGMGCSDGILCVCPVELDADGQISGIITGANLLGFVPDGGEIIGVIHPDGQDAVEDFCAEFADEIAALCGAN